MDLFSSQNEQIPLALPDGEAYYYPEFFNKKEADQLFEILSQSISWQQDDIKVFGKVYPQPRLTALYASNNRTYTYSNITMQPHQFTKELLAIKKKVEQITSEHFTTCLLNLYRDGQDSNGWHSDNEKELGPNPTIASVSFGEDRWFHFKHKTKNLKQKILLQHGSLLLMKGTTQENWLHQIPKSKKITKPRINLTFRIIK
ncbi:alpha-ketoglutarate-dependent dioxygenase AlkB [Aquimarina litoralis]|uniref:alpha-ketoglutarate-dependent dioxygenase AlkB family protein n=1 Tax=Aquimarina litoralis TaxID=584605 RepID=UPI001FECFC76|nr:alpha-ketoglutarate-dependent dioxygenase AlkB [Aquimarina litoralis]